MLNVCCLMGRLVADPELRHTPNGISVTTFTIAVDRSYTPKGKDKQTDFISIVAWRGTADFCAKYFTKGQLIAVQGSIQTRKYTDREGNKRTAFEVIASNVYFAEPKRDTASTGNKNTYHAEEKAPDVSADTGDFEEISPYSDLPF
jgi:single-strand DNA-binding protein